MHTTRTLGIPLGPGGQRKTLTPATYKVLDDEAIALEVVCYFVAAPFFRTTHALEPGEANPTNRLKNEKTASIVQEDEESTRVMYITL